MVRAKQNPRQYVRSVDSQNIMLSKRYAAIKKEATRRDKLMKKMEVHPAIKKKAAAARSGRQGEKLEPRPKTPRAGRKSKAQKQEEERVEQQQKFVDWLLKDEGDKAEEETENEGEAPSTQVD